MLDRLYKHIQANFVALILISTLVVLGLWAMGYILNGFYDYKFDLTSCWVGFSAISAGVIKYFIDSWLNSQRGNMPKFGGGDNG